MCGIDALGVRPPFQGSGLCALVTQGGALGCDGASLWDSKPRSGHPPCVETKRSGRHSSHRNMIPQEPQARPSCCARPAASPTSKHPFPSAKGAAYRSPGNHPRNPRPARTWSPERAAQSCWHSADPQHHALLVPSAKGAAYRNPGHRPGNSRPARTRSPERAAQSCWHSADPQHYALLVPSAKGADYRSPGHRPGNPRPA